MGLLSGLAKILGLSSRDRRQKQMEALDVEEQNARARIEASQKRKARLLEQEAQEFAAVDAKMHALADKSVAQINAFGDEIEKVDKSYGGNPHDLAKQLESIRARLFELTQKFVELGEGGLYELGMSARGALNVDIMKLQESHQNAKSGQFRQMFEGQIIALKRSSRFVANFETKIEGSELTEINGLLDELRVLTKRLEGVTKGYLAVLNKATKFVGKKVVPEAIQNLQILGADIARDDAELRELERVQARGDRRAATGRARKRL